MLRDDDFAELAQLRTRLRAQGATPSEVEVRATAWLRARQQRRNFEVIERDAAQLARRRAEGRRRGTTSRNPHAPGNVPAAAWRLFADTLLGAVGLGAMLALGAPWEVVASCGVFASCVVALRTLGAML